MIQNVYVDVYFCFNFLMDFIVILVTSIIIHNKKSIFRITLAAVTGAVYSTISLVSDWRGILSVLCTYVIISATMVLIAFGRQSNKDALKNVAVLYIVSFSLSGMVNAAYYCTSLGHSIINKAGGNVFGNISIIMILCVAVFFLTTVMGVIENIRCRAGLIGNMFDVNISAEGKTINVRALRDTGNSLYEPITGKPVSVIEEKSIESLKKEKLRLLFVPYNTVGKTNGLMEAFIADSMSIDGRVAKDVIIGIHKGKLSQNNRYSMILNPSMIIETKL